MKKRKKALKMKKKKTEFQEKNKKIELLDSTATLFFPEY